MNNDLDIEKYCKFLSDLADKYFYDVYLVKDKLNEINTPLPGSFDEIILPYNKLNVMRTNKTFDFSLNFRQIYGDGNEQSRGIPLFVFNYLDYKLWAKYAAKICGEKTKEDSEDRIKFFESLGCSSFDLKVFQQFYFSRTRRSLEHYYPQANASGENGRPNVGQVNCLGNYAMIGSDMNSSGSNWSPIVKLDHYLDASGKIKRVSVASIKFMIMMQMCKDNKNKCEPGHEWIFKDMQLHQGKMLEILSE